MAWLSRSGSDLASTSIGLGLCGTGGECVLAISTALRKGACVFFSGVLSVSVLYNEWQTKTRFLIALLSVPTGMTAAEAFAPHTWDTPFLFLVGAALVWFLFGCVPDNFNFPYI